MCIGTNAAIIGLWIWLYRPVFDYLAVIFSREELTPARIEEFRALPDPIEW